MPLHDWSAVDAGTFHDFHQGWTIRIRDALNAGLLPDGYFAMADQRVSGPEPDVIALSARPPQKHPPQIQGSGTVVADALPRLRQSASIAAAVYARKANRIIIRHRQGRVVAFLEIVSPGNKSSTHALRAFIGKAVEFLQNGIHLLVVDLFPPTPRDPGGLHQAIWNELSQEPFAAAPPDKPLVVAAFYAAEEITAYVEPLAVGDRLPDAPLFLEPGLYVNVPLEMTYQQSWAVMPPVLQQAVQRTNSQPPARSADPD